MGKRKRKIYEILEPVQADDLAFTKNKCSDLARMTHTHLETVSFDIWFDKHYFIREQHGDDDGKRDGINIELVKALVQVSAKHLLYYSLKVQGFKFLNFEETNRAERVVLTQVYIEGLNLNVIVEYHYIALNRYEATIKTALRKDDFTFSDGQYQIKIEPDGTSTLLRNERRVLKTVSYFDLSKH